MPEPLPRQLLFVCSHNRWRSPTAEGLFEGHATAVARSAGTEAGADVVFVMEKRHADRLRAKFADALAGKPVLNPRIPDKYRFQDPALVALLRDKLAAYL